KIARKAAQRYIDDYFAAHPRVRAFIDATLAFGREHGYVTTLLGRRRYLPDLRSANPVARNAAERMAMNAPVQGTASDMIKIAMVRVRAAMRERSLQARMLLQVHDELLFEAPPAEVPVVEALARDIMEAALPLDAPALAAVVREFGDVLAPDGTLDRKKLAAIVFADPGRRRRLEGILHPAIRARFDARLEALAREGFDGLVVFDAPVMIESGGYKHM